MPEVLGPLTASQDGIRLLAMLVGAAIGTCLLFVPPRRRIPIERPIEPDHEPERTEEDSESQ